MNLYKSLFSKTLILIAAVGITSCGHQSKKSSKSISAIVNSKHRSAENKARDKYRHPVETLAFFELEPDMTVVEVSPGMGWYTEILGPYLKNSGTLYLTLFSEKSKRSYAPRLNKATKDFLSNNKSLFGKVKFATLEAPDDMGPIAPENSVDRVLTFRNVHSWQGSGHGLEAFKTFFKALKPGGILGVVQHRAPEKSRVGEKPENGYMKESQVIALAIKAGFKLAGKSEINANTRDSADHKGGVWALPPSLRNKEQNKDKFLAIGESDRMTLKFVKP